jgi:cytoskeleton protein RodZ
MQVDTDSLGSYLRRERELRERSLQDISAATKIQLRFLEALERDEYDQLPPAPFVVGFLRAYAQCLSLEPEEIIATYHTRHSSSEGMEKPALLVTAYQARRPTRFRLVGASLGVAVVILGLGLALQLLSRETAHETKVSLDLVVSESAARQSSPVVERPPLMSHVPPSQPVEPAPPAPQLPAAVVQEVQKESRTSTSTPLAPRGAESARPAAVEPSSAAPSSQLLTLQAIALEDTWLRVEIDGNKRHDVLLAAGKTVHWEAQERFLMTIGNARGTRLVLNGKDLPLFPTRNNVLRDFQVTRQLLD